MLNYKILAVIKKELREKLFSKSFILMTLLIPLFMFGILGIQTFIMSYSEDKINLLIITEDSDFTGQLQMSFEKTEMVKSRLYTVTFDTRPKNEIEGIISSKKEKLLNGTINGIVFIPLTSLEDKNLEYYSKAPSFKIINKIKEPINKVLLNRYFAGKNISQKDLQYAKGDINFNEFKISSKEEIEKAGEGNRAVSFILTFLLYFALIMIGSQMMSSVIQEKSTRVVEVLLSSIESKDLLTGKILGTAITAVIQMIVWMSPLIIVISTTWFMLPEDFVITLSGLQISYFLVNYLIALITFLGLFAAVGSIFENPQESQQGAWPVMILIMIPFFISVGTVENPENSIARISSMLPFASLIVMPGRMSTVDIPLFEIMVSLIVNIATMIFVFYAAGKIYRIGILKTGKKPNFGEVIKWLKYSG